MESALDLSHTEAGLLITIASVARMGSTMASGTLAPRYGSRVIIGGGVIGSGSVDGPPGPFSELRNGGSLNGAHGGHRRRRAYAYDGVALRLVRGADPGVGGGVGFGGEEARPSSSPARLVPVLVAVNAENGWRYAWEGLGVLVVIVGVAALLAVKESPGNGASGQGGAALERGGVRSWPIEAYKTPVVWLVTLIAFTSGWSNSIFSTFFGVYLAEENTVSIATVGQLLIAIGVLSVGSGVMWGRLSDRMGRGQAFLLSFFLQGLSFALFAFLPGMGSFIASSVIMGLTLRATYTICAASAGDYVPVQYSSAAFALMGVGAGLGSTVSPALGGVVADSVGMNWSFASALGAGWVGGRDGWVTVAPERSSRIPGAFRGVILFRSRPGNLGYSPRIARQA